MPGRRGDETRGHLRFLGMLAVVGFVVSLAAWLVVSNPRRPVTKGLADQSWAPPSPVRVADDSWSRAAAPTSSAAKTAAPSPNAAQVRAQVAARIADLAAGQPEGSVSVAALNTATGAGYSSGADSGMWTASAYKLLVLETLLLQSQESGTAMSESDEPQVAPMIEQSDNAAGYDLFVEVGGNPALASATRRFGMTHTTMGRSDPTFMTTSAADCLLLLKNLVTKGALDADSRSLALGLMRNVEADQRWGVGAVADRGTTFANKNGWLAVDDSNSPGEQDEDRWIVNSLGVVTIKGQQVVMAVLTQHQRSFDDGVRLVEQLAKAVAPAVAR